MEKKIKLIILEVVAFIVIAGVGILIIALNSPNNIEVDSQITNSTEMDSQMTNNISSNPTWHKVGTYTGSGDDTVSINAKGTKIRVVSTAMPIKNYANNYLTTTLQQGDKTLGKSNSNWNSKSKIAKKTGTIEVSCSGKVNIEIHSYELRWWTVEIYECS